MYVFALVLACDACLLANTANTTSTNPSNKKLKSLKILNHASEYCKDKQNINSAIKMNTTLRCV